MAHSDARLANRILIGPAGGAIAGVVVLIIGQFATVMVEVAA
ncbi:MAG TPA: hypothetical protein VJS42_12205 [Steroidobacteraceae bacterium]|nr:hypothetical protein [Steroidobacteraceae bacterium]